MIFRLVVSVNTDSQAGQGIGGLEVEGQVLAHEAGNAVGRAVVLAQVQTREPRQGQGRLVEQVLIRVIQPENAAVRAEEEVEDLQPVRREVLPLVHDQGVEAPGLGDGGGEHPVQDGAPETGLVHPAIVKGFATATQELIAEAVKGLGADLGEQGLQAVRQGGG